MSVLVAHVVVNLKCLCNRFEIVMQERMSDANKGYLIYLHTYLI